MSHFLTTQEFLSWLNRNNRTVRPSCADLQRSRRFESFDCLLATEPPFENTFFKRAKICTVSLPFNHSLIPQRLTWRNAQTVRENNVRRECSIIFSVPIGTTCTVCFENVLQGIHVTCTRVREYTMDTEMHVAYLIVDKRKKSKDVSLS